MSLRKAFSKIAGRVGQAVKAVAPIASFIPGPIGIAGMAVSALSAARAQSRATSTAAPMFSDGMMQTAFPSLPALGGMAARILPGIGAAGGAVVRGGRVAISAGRGLFGAANRWCARNPKTCGALGGASVVAEMMRTGEIRRPGRRINPMNVKAARRAIRRIRGVRKICGQIERLMPKRSAGRCPSPGVITRREASRALRR